MSTSSGGQAIDGAGEWNRARNQALIREMNEQVTAMAGTTPDDQVLVICECGDVRCAVPVSVTRIDYERVRASATQFVVKRGHELHQGESFVEEYAEFAVVEKLDDEAVAVPLDAARVDGQLSASDGTPG